MVDGIIHAGISTRDMDKSIWFYSEVLGGRVIMEIEEPKGTPWIVTVQYPNGTCVELFYPRADFPLGTKLGRNHLCLGVSDIHAIEERLDTYGVTVTGRATKVRDGNMQVWCIDPNGYRVEFIQYIPGAPQLTHGEKKVFW
ncbi:MAG: VOC family protein [Clostridiaceae bacterium]|mgnify:CR=1 FL=1|nr:VOC family protein [Clostridiaceae bacterium]